VSRQANFQRAYAKIITLAVILLALSVAGKAQNASPLGGIGSLQFFDNSGAPLTSGVVYIYNAGTSTQASVYTDSTATTLQPNPVTFGSGARSSIWLANSTFVKVVLCVQNDGAFCTAGDILFSADQVPIGSISSGGGGSPFTGIFISSTASPATSGVLRLASGDTVCFRNAAGSTNICFSKNSNDILSWGGGSFQFPEIAAPTCGAAGFDCLWADNTAHRIKGINNGGTAAQYVLSGNDIGTTDNVTGVHFGATQQTFGNTAPTTGQLLQFNGTNIVGVTPTPLIVVADLATQAADVVATTLVTPAANGFYRFECFIVITQVATTNSTLPACQVVYTNESSAGTVTLNFTATATGNTIGLSGTTALGATVAGPLPVIYAKSGTAIKYQTTGYTSVGGTPMQFSLHVRLTGPF
jgi:hypothetical protein